MDQWRAVHNEGVEAQQSHHFYEEWDHDPYPDPHQSEESDPDPHQRDEDALAPHAFRHQFKNGNNFTFEYSNTLHILPSKAQIQCPGYISC